MQSNSNDNRGVNTHTNNIDYNETIPLRSYLEAIMTERDKNYDGRFRAAEIAVNAALAAQEKAVATAFLAAEKATLKAEEAQRVYNEGLNEVNNRMNEQYDRMIPRVEAAVKFDALDNKIEVVRNETVTLREFKSTSIGTRIGAKEVGVYIVAALSVVISIVLHYLH